MTLSPELQAQAIELLTNAAVVAAGVGVFYWLQKKLVEKFGKDTVENWSKTIADVISKAQDAVPALEQGPWGIGLDTLELLFRGLESIDSPEERHAEAKKFIKAEIARLGGDPNDLSDKHLDAIISGMVRVLKLNKTEQSEK